MNRLVQRLAEHVRLTPLESEGSWAFTDGVPKDVQVTSLIEVGRYGCVVGVGKDNCAVVSEVSGDELESYLQGVVSMAIMSDTAAVAGFCGLVWKKDWDDSFTVVRFTENHGKTLQVISKGQQVLSFIDIHRIIQDGAYALKVCRERGIPPFDM